MENIVYARTFVRVTPLGVEIENKWGDPPPTPLSKGQAGDVILMHGRYTGKGPVTNVPRYFTFSGNDNWGYLGAGPTCLVKNILYHFTNGNNALVEKHWVEFLGDIVEKFPIDKSCVIHRAVITGWIEEKHKPQAEVIPFPSK